MEDLVVRSTQDPTDVRIINSYPSKVTVHVFVHIPMLVHTHTIKLRRTSAVQLPHSFF